MPPRRPPAPDPGLHGIDGSAQHNQWHRQMVDQAEPAIEIDGLARGIHAFSLASIGQGAIGHREVGVQSRLEAQVADLPRSLESTLTGFNAARWIKRAIEHAEVCVTPAGSLR